MTAHLMAYKAGGMVCEGEQVSGLRMLYAVKPFFLLRVCLYEGSRGSVTLCFNAVLSLRACMCVCYMC